MADVSKTKKEVAKVNPDVEILKSLRDPLPGEVKEVKVFADRPFYKFVPNVEEVCFAKGIEELPDNFNKGQTKKHAILEMLQPDDTLKEVLCSDVMCVKWVDRLFEGKPELEKVPVKIVCDDYAKSANGEYSNLSFFVLNA